MSGQKIVPNLWFDKEAEEAARFYTSLFKNSEILEMSRYSEAGQEIHGQKPGSVMTVDFALDGYRFTALNGGPGFKFNPSISFFANRESEEEVNTLWEQLSEGGSVLMELQKYPFSERYGWLADRYGLSWQISVADVGGAADHPFVDVCRRASRQGRRGDQLLQFGVPALLGRRAVSLLRRPRAGQGRKHSLRALHPRRSALCGDGERARLMSSTSTRRSRSSSTVRIRPRWTTSGRKCRRYPNLSNAVG